jgi:hypothetical protein
VDDLEGGWGEVKCMPEPSGPWTPTSSPHSLRKVAPLATTPKPNKPPAADKQVRIDSSARRYHLGEMLTPN